MFLTRVKVQNHQFQPVQEKFAYQKDTPKNGDNNCSEKVDLQEQKSYT